MTDGRETTRLGDRQTGGENVMEKQENTKKTHPAYSLHPLRIYSFPAIWFNMRQWCFDNKAHVPVLSQNNSMRR